MKIIVEDRINNINLINQKMDPIEILTIIDKLSDHPISEIKIYQEFASKYILHITTNNIQEWKIDYPIKQNSIHKQCYATKEQCVAIVRELFEKGNIDDVPGFIDVPIQDFTLDEMIEFKKEEEMMLRGEDPFVEEEKEDLTTETLVPQEKKEIIKQPETPQKAPIKKDSKSNNYFQI